MDGNRLKKDRLFFQLIDADGGKLCVVWKSAASSPSIERVYLPLKKGDPAVRFRREFPGRNMTERKMPGRIACKIGEIYNGKKTEFDLSVLDWNKVRKFAAKVLREARKIPRGKVIAYSELAERSGFPRAARAIGTVMAGNPFPPVIPCHRVVRADGSLGGFGSGQAMKKELLIREGIRMDAAGRIPRKYFWK